MLLTSHPAMTSFTPVVAERPNAMNHRSSDLELLGWLIEDLIERPAWHSQAACQALMPSCSSPRTTDRRHSGFTVMPVLTTAVVAPSLSSAGKLASMSATASGAARPLSSGVSPASGDPLS